MIRTSDDGGRVCGTCGGSLCHHCGLPVMPGKQWCSRDDCQRARKKRWWREHRGKKGLS